MREPVKLDDGKWRHICFAFDGKSTTAYVDGKIADYKSFFKWMPASEVKKRFSEEKEC